MRRFLCSVLAFILVFYLAPVLSVGASSVHISVPAEYSIDGKTSYDLSPSEYNDLLSRVHESIQDELNKMCLGFYNYESMTVNDDCTGFTIVVNDVTQTAEEITAENLMYEMYAKYASYSGKKTEGIRIFYNNMLGDLLWSVDVGEPPLLVLESATKPTTSSQTTSSSVASSKSVGTSRQAPTPESTKSSGSFTVWIPASGEKYHSIPNCGRMNPSKAHEETIEWAKANGYTACSKCW